MRAAFDTGPVPASSEAAIAEAARITSRLAYLLACIASGPSHHDTAASTSARALFDRDGNALGDEDALRLLSRDLDPSAALAIESVFHAVQEGLDVLVITNDVVRRAVMDLVAHHDSSSVVPGAGTPGSTSTVEVAADAGSADSSTPRVGQGGAR